MNDLPKYNPDTRCPKCGHDIVTTEYWQPKDYGKIRDEHFVRICMRCGYGWREACLAETDFKKQATAPDPTAYGRIETINLDNVKPPVYLLDYIELLEVALQPFARLADKIPDAYQDDNIMWGLTRIDLTAGDFRRAKKALATLVSGASE